MLKKLFNDGIIVAEENIDKYGINKQNINMYKYKIFN